MLHFSKLFLHVTKSRVSLHVDGRLKKLSFMKAGLSERMSAVGLPGIKQIPRDFLGNPTDLSCLAFLVFTNQLLHGSSRSSMISDQRNIVLTSPCQGTYEAGGLMILWAAFIHQIGSFANNQNMYIFIHIHINIYIGIYMLVCFLSTYQAPTI